MSPLKMCPDCNVTADPAPITAAPHARVLGSAMWERTFLAPLIMPFWPPSLQVKYALLAPFLKIGHFFL